MQDIKAFLNRGRTIAHELRAMEYQIEQLYNRRDSLGGTVSGERVQSSPAVTDKMAETVAELTDCINEYLAKTARLLEVKNEIQAAIEAVADDRQRLVLFERYVNCKRWEDIAADNCYSWRTVHRIHDRALQKLALFGTLLT